MLKHINPILSPNLVKILMDMGHGDEIVFADRNFPSVALARRLERYDAAPITPLLAAVLEYFPLDHAVAHPVAFMRIPADADCDDAIQQQYRQLLHTAAGAPVGVELHERQDFYDRAGRAFAVVATGETARFANIILRKGIVRA